MQKIMTCLWFDSNAEEAVNFYTSVFRNSKIISSSRYGTEVPGREGQILTMIFELEGEQFMALNGGAHFNFNPAISIFVNCGSQEEIDYFWDKLTKGGEEIQCGWLTDKFGVSWQIVPSVLGEMLYSGEPERSSQMMKAMLKMKKLDLGKLTEAYNS